MTDRMIGFTPNLSQSEDVRQRPSRQGSCVLAQKITRKTPGCFAIARDAPRPKDAESLYALGNQARLAPCLVPKALSLNKGVRVT